MVLTRLRTWTCVVPPPGRNRGSPTVQDPCCCGDADNSPPAARDHRSVEGGKWACFFCFRVWCHGKGQRRLCDTLSAVGYGGTVNEKHLSNDEFTVSCHDVTYIRRTSPCPALRSPATVTTVEGPWRSPDRFCPGGCPGGHDTQLIGHRVARCFPLPPCVPCETRQRRRPTVPTWSVACCASPRHVADSG